VHPNIAFAGLTAAGKTTHARLLAEDLGYDYVSATEIFLELASLDALKGTDEVWFNHFDAIEQLREGDHLDDALDHQLLTLCEARNRTVFDTWALAWISPVPVVRVWLGSDELSRRWKCYVSQLGKPGATMNKCEALIRKKDEGARTRFLRKHGFDLCVDHADFEVILDNTEYIDAPTREASDRGIAGFHPLLRKAVRHALDHW
jgi:cytidylate kinase